LYNSTLYSTVIEGYETDKESSAGFIRQKRRKKIQSKFHLLLNKRWNPHPPSMFNEPGPAKVKEKDSLSQRAESLL
jgi:hypothetical protein